MPDSINVIDLVNAVKETQAEEGKPIFAGQEQTKVGMLTAKRIPQVSVYHLSYDDHGNVIDYHTDHWRITLEPLYRKLQRTTPLGKPIWALQPPAGFEKPTEDIKCRHTQCPRYFRSIEDRERHEKVAHKEMWEINQKAIDREQVDQRNKLLERQIEAQEAQMELLRQVLASRGLDVPTDAEAAVTVRDSKLDKRIKKKNRL